MSKSPLRIVAVLLAGCLAAPPAAASEFIFQAFLSPTLPGALLWNIFEEEALASPSQWGRMPLAGHRSDGVQEAIGDFEISPSGLASETFDAAAGAHAQQHFQDGLALLLQDLRREGMEGSLGPYLMAVMADPLWRGLPWRIYIEPENNLVELKTILPRNSPSFAQPRGFRFQRVGNEVTIESTSPGGLREGREIIDSSNVGSYIRRQRIFSVLQDYANRWAQEGPVSPSTLRVVVKLGVSPGIRKSIHLKRFSGRQRFWWVAVAYPLTDENLKEACMTQFPELSSDDHFQVVAKSPGHFSAQSEYLLRSANENAGTVSDAPVVRLTAFWDLVEFLGPSELNYTLRHPCTVRSLVQQLKKKYRKMKLKKIQVFDSTTKKPLGPFEKLRDGQQLSLVSVNKGSSQGSSRGLLTAPPLLEADINLGCDLVFDLGIQPADDGERLAVLGMTYGKDIEWNGIGSKRISRGRDHASLFRLDPAFHLAGKEPASSQRPVIRWSGKWWIHYADAIEADMALIAKQLKESSPLRPPRKLFVTDNPNDPMVQVASTQDGSRVASLAYSMGPKIWIQLFAAREDDMRRRQEVFTWLATWELRGVSYEVRKLGFSADGKSLFVVGTDGLQIVDVENVPQHDSSIVELRHFGDGAIVAAAFSPDRRSLALGNTKGILWLLDVTVPTSPRTVFRWQGEAGTGISRLLFSQDGKVLYSASHFGGQVRKWRLQSDHHHSPMPHRLSQGA